MKKLMCAACVFFLFCRDFAKKARPEMLIKTKGHFDKHARTRLNVFVE